MFWPSPRILPVFTKTDHGFLAPRIRIRKLGRDFLLHRIEELPNRLPFQDMLSLIIDIGAFIRAIHTVVVARILFVESVPLG